MIGKKIHFYPRRLFWSIREREVQGCLCCFRYGLLSTKGTEMKLLQQAAAYPLQVRDHLAARRNNPIRRFALDTFSDDCPLEAVPFSWHAFSPRDNLSKLSSAHSYPSKIADCKRYSSNSSCFYVFTTYHSHTRTNPFFIISRCQNAVMSQRHHVIMSSCHHAVKDFGTQGERL